MRNRGFAISNISMRELDELVKKGEVKEITINGTKDTIADVLLEDEVWFTFKDVDSVTDNTPDSKIHSYQIRRKFYSWLRTARTLNKGRSTILPYHIGIATAIYDGYDGFRPVQIVRNGDTSDDLLAAANFLRDLEVARLNPDRKIILGTFYLHNPKNESLEIYNATFYITDYATILRVFDGEIQTISNLATMLQFMSEPIGMSVDMHCASDSYAMRGIIQNSVPDISAALNSMMDYDAPAESNIGAVEAAKHICYAINSMNVKEIVVDSKMRVFYLDSRDDRDVAAAIREMDILAKDIDTLSYAVFSIIRGSGKCMEVTIVQPDAATNTHMMVLNRMRGILWSSTRRNLGWKVSKRSIKECDCEGRR